MSPFLFPTLYELGAIRLLRNSKKNRILGEQQSLFSLIKPIFCTNVVKTNTHVLYNTIRAFHLFLTLRLLLLHLLNQILNPINSRIIPFTICRCDLEQVHVIHVCKSVGILNDIRLNILFRHQRQCEVLHIKRVLSNHVIHFFGNQNGLAKRQQVVHDLRATHTALLQRLNNRGIHLLYG